MNEGMNADDKIGESAADPESTSVPTSAASEVSKAAMSEEDRAVLLELGGTAERISEYEVNTVRAATQPRRALVDSVIIAARHDAIVAFNGGLRFSTACR